MLTRTLTDALDLVLEHPRRYLDCECALSLGAFLVGYKMADASAAQPVRQLLERIPGPDAADACTRAFLVRGGGVAGLRYAIDELRLVLASVTVTSTPGPLATTAPIEQVRTALTSGRLGMYFGEPTIMWVSTYYHGFLCGLASVDRSAWQREEGQLRRFETRLRTAYGHETPAWHELIRAYEGPCESGIKRFVELWDELESGLER